MEIIRLILVLRIQLLLRVLLRRVLPLLSLMVVPPRMGLPEEEMEVRTLRMEGILQMILAMEVPTRLMEEILQMILAMEMRTLQMEATAMLILQMALEMVIATAMAPATSPAQYPRPTLQPPPPQPQLKEETNNSLPQSSLPSPKHPPTLLPLLPRLILYQPPTLLRLSLPQPSTLPHPNPNPLLPLPST